MMERFHAKQCLAWYNEHFNNADAWGDEDEIVRIKCLLSDIAEGKTVVCVPFSDEIMHHVFEHNENQNIRHETRTHYEDIGFNRACKVMVATGRMKK